MRTEARFALVLGVAIILAGCGASTATTAPSTGSPGTGNGGAGGGIVFTGQVNFTGVIPIHGSFTDSGTASTVQSCGAYATSGLPFRAGWAGPNPDHSPGDVGGQTLSVSPIVPFKDFHGPGTYTSTYFIALKIADNAYTNDSVTIVVNADSSGSLTFANANGGAAVGNGAESGTMTWTCANG